jgi:hypothetical protein
MKWTPDVDAGLDEAEEGLTLVDGDHVEHVRQQTDRDARWTQLVTRC